MKILGYVHTFNNGATIEGVIRGFQKQTYPIPEILLVDNASTDHILSHSFPEQVTIIRNSDNLGTSGAVEIGFQYGLDHHYDMIWIMDGDSLPSPYALEKLIEFYNSLDIVKQDSVFFLSSLPSHKDFEHAEHGVVFSSHGYHSVHPESHQTYYSCDATFWSGTLYNLKLIRKVGLPIRDFFIDYDDVELCYRAKQQGYQSYIVAESNFEHQVGDDSQILKKLKFGPLKFQLLEKPPMRYYYSFRNAVYFFVYKFREGSRIITVGLNLADMAKQMIKIFFFHQNPKPILIACFRGIWDGLNKNIENRY